MSLPPSSAGRFAVPAGYRAQLSGAQLDERADWLAALPATAAHHADEWGLTLDGEPMHGFVAVVWPMRTRDDTPVVLKLSWPHEETEDEGLALATWAGDGTVTLLAEDGDALLLERLDPHRSLDDEPLGEAVPIAARLLRRLSVPAPPLHRSMADLAARSARLLPSWTADTPIPRRIVAATVEHCRALADRPANLLVNEDLHFQNVLRAHREPWLVIDPKPIAGEPEFGVVPLLCNRVDKSAGRQGIRSRFDSIVAIAELDRDRARGWTLLRAVRNWLWSLGGDGQPSVDTIAEIAAAMVP